MKYFSLAATVLAALTLAACDTDGPAEEAGEDLDDAVEETEDTFEEAGEEVDDETRR